MTRHKRLSFTLYAAGMYRHALAPWLEGAERETCLRRSDELVSTAQRLHWCPKRERFFDNLPWETQEGGPRCHDRTLAMAVLFDQCPNQSIAGCTASLAECPPEMGFSYPANAGWRLWALAKANRIDVVLNDLKHRWSTLRSVRENRTISEDWEPLPDSTAQWSHCAVVPLYILAQCVAGIQSVAPGFQRCTIRPQLADLASLELSVQTPQGPIHFNSKLEREAHRVRIEVPQGIDTEWISTHGALALAPGRHELYVPASLG
jgi:hypothetical protein